ncbi:MAG: hypothetical protein ACI3W6_03090 [Clostridia bacterium]
MGLFLWMGILLVLIVLDRYIVARQYHNRSSYRRRKRAAMARR